MKLFILFLSSFVLLHSSTLAGPNIIYILADDLGYGDVQCLNPKRGKIKTPNLDRLASQGMTFTDAHSGSSVCTPTRYGLLTGRYAWRTRLRSGVLDGGNDDPLIDADRLTVASFLRQQGYRTACIGKWHLGFQSDVTQKKEKGRSGLPVGTRIIGGPTTRGFDLYFGCSNARTMSSLIENDRVIEHIEAIDMLPRLSERATSYLAACSKSDAPFFLYLPLTSPHTPIIPSMAWRGKSGLSDYADFVMQTDAVVGDVLAALDRHGMSENTLVLFSSDNGCSPAAKTTQLEKQGHYASAGYRGYKADIWEGGHRVPFFVRWPGRVKAGSQCDQLICHVDFMATCAAILNAKLPDSAAEDSVSILPALLSNDGGPVRDHVVHHSISGRFAIRQGKWKLAFCPGSGGWGKPSDADAAKGGMPSVQLYDMQADSAEKTNLQQTQPQVVEKLTEQLNAIIENGRSTPGTPQRNDVSIVINKPNRKAAKE
ncbi:MAG: arylsulfatase [Verrucomicrobiaceae bacterium]|nr:arylsulfatase [Verrucomicrobiaceae bacterium]